MEISTDGSIRDGFPLGKFEEGQLFFKLDGLILKILFSGLVPGQHLTVPILTFLESRSRDNSFQFELNIVDLAVFVGNDNFKFSYILLEGGYDDFLFPCVFNFLNFCVLVGQNDLLRRASFFVLFDLGLQLPDGLVLL